LRASAPKASSLALENGLVAHPAVAEAAVIAIPHPVWGERPLAVVVLRPGASATAEELREFLAPNFVSYALPDTFAFVGEIPKTSTGKLHKAVLRERFAASPGQPGSPGAGEYGGGRASRPPARAG
jgi:fatty-acyl-CoA synthase